MKGKSVMASIFEKMIQDFRKKDMAQLLDECMKLDAKKAKKIPLRYRLIAIGFVSHMTLDELDVNSCTPEIRQKRHWFMLF